MEDKECRNAFWKFDLRIETLVYLLPRGCHLQLVTPAWADMFLLIGQAISEYLYVPHV